MTCRPLLCSASPASHGFVLLNPGKPAPHETKGVIAPDRAGRGFPGFGMGSAYCLSVGRGHVNFGPTNAIEIELLKYLMPNLGHVSYERVCSASHPNLYHFMRDVQELRAGLAQGRAGLPQDPTPVIVQQLSKSKLRSATCTLDLFISSSQQPELR